MSLCALRVCVCVLLLLAYVGVEPESFIGFHAPSNTLPTSVPIYFFTCAPVIPPQPLIGSPRV